MKLYISKDERSLAGEIDLEGSKSISNRVLIIKGLCGGSFRLGRLSTSADTQTLVQLLEEGGEVLDAGHAGTTFRFMTAYLALQEGTQTLTGSERMKQRPIEALVDALNSIGAHIEYLGEEGYPPLRIHPPKDLGSPNVVEIDAGVSSQFITALLLIAPLLPQGLWVILKGRVVSQSYIDMTLALMDYFGVDCQQSERGIWVAPQSYTSRPFEVEADWSAASYYYALVGMAKQANVKLKGLRKSSVQGDSILSSITKDLGVATSFEEDGIRLHKIYTRESVLDWNFLNCPDIAQTMAVLCSGLGREATLRELSTLYIKETNRVLALQQELAKVGVSFEKVGKDAYEVKGQAKYLNGVPLFATYKDHRMAMSFATLAMALGQVGVEDPLVVEKSYPKFWSDLERLGFRTELRV